MKIMDARLQGHTTDKIFAVRPPRRGRTFFLSRGFSLLREAAQAQYKLTIGRWLTLRDAISIRDAGPRQSRAPSRSRENLRAAGELQIISRVRGFVQMSKWVNDRLLRVRRYSVDSPFERRTDYFFSFLRDTWASIYGCCSNVVLQKQRIINQLYLDSQWKMARRNVSESSVRV